MSLLSLILPAHVQRLIGPAPGGKPGESGVLLDAVMEEEIQHKATVTQYPVELGADITDHVIIEPMRYKMTGAITDTPMTYAGTSYNHPDESLRSLAAWALLADLMAARVPFTIKTGWLTYDDMVIESLASSKDKSTKNVVNFEATLRQLNIVSVEVTEAKLRGDRQANGADPVQNNGTAKKEAVGQTFLDLVINGLRNSAGLPTP